MKKLIIRTLVIQYVLAAIYLIGVALWDKTATPSALLGCMAALLPKTYFGFRMLRGADEQEAATWLGYAYRSEIGKWVLLGVIFAVAFGSDYPWNPVALFSGFVLLQMSGWLAPMVLKGNGY